MGGIQTTAGSRRARPLARSCPHPATLSTIAAGLERIVCETCGHLSFRWHEDVSDYIDRERVARGDAGPETDPGPFAAHARLNIRSRYELYPEPAAMAV